MAFYTRVPTMLVLLFPYFLVLTFLSSTQSGLSTHPSFLIVFLLITYSCPANVWFKPLLSPSRSPPLPPRRSPATISAVCLPTSLTKCACVCEGQRQTDLCLVDYSECRLYKQPNTHTHTRVRSLNLSLQLQLCFQVGERRLEEMSDALVLRWRRGRCQCAAPSHISTQYQ